jgi:hypothetical protein
MGVTGAESRADPILLLRTISILFSSERGWDSIEAVEALRNKPSLSSWIAGTAEASGESLAGMRSLRYPGLTGGVLLLFWTPLGLVLDDLAAALILPALAPPK